MMQMERIGNGEFWTADCFEAMEQIPDGSVDMVLCDLPYGTISCKWDVVLPFERLWPEYARVCNGAVVLTASQPFSSICVSSNPSGFRHAWVWNKGKAANFPQAKRHPLKIHEDVLVFGQQSYRPQMTKGVERQKGGYQTKHEVSVSGGCPAIRNNLYYPKSILDFSTAGNKETGLHPTQKPVALFEYLIRTYTDEGMTVLDNTAGSGTTAIAAENAGRKWICIERDPDYAAKAIQRIKDHVV